jgi:ubiquinone/menaquinone biosynthesis C-methylase UbiE
MADQTQTQDATLSDRARREREHFDRLAGEQGEAWWGHLAPAGRKRSFRRASLVIDAAQIKPGHRVLEIGCGGGFFTGNYIPMVASQAAVVAVDISPGLVDAARAKAVFAKHPNLSFEVQNVESLSYSDASFDAVIGSSILHHIDLPKALPELCRVLKPGGRFVFAEPNALNPAIFLEKHFKIGHQADQASDDEESINRFTIRKILAAHGLEVERLTPYDFLHPLTPGFLQPVVGAAGRFCELIPGIREFGGSVLLVARKRS